MAKSLNAMNMLLELAQRKLNQAAEVLAKANHDVAEARQQLLSLETFRQEYIIQQNNLATDGINIKDFNNYSIFIKNIDQAIEAQKQTIDHFLAIAKHHTQHWQICQTKKRSFEVVLEKNHRQQQKLASQREQKQMDEFSSNQHRTALASSQRT